VLIQLRCADAAGAAHLDAAIAALSGPATGLALMAVEPLRTNPARKENFGYADGISQPAAHTVPGESAWSDQVPRGELLLGYPTLRDKQYPVPEKADALLDNGTFLVVRKLRQWTGRLARQVENEAARLGLDPELVYAKLMGRDRAGKPLAEPGHSSNDFNFRQDANGAQCPIHAHIRRSNPRQFSGPTGLTNTMPRILRRGMSYGAAPTVPADDAERGLMFMAYGAHPAEQFEVIQRWLAGANSSGGYADQPDPLMAVVDPDTRPNRLYTFEHEGVPYAMDLGPQPFVTLEWGGYFFVPSIPTLRSLPALAELPLPVAAPSPAPASAPPLDDPAAWQLWLEDQNTRDAAWAWVRAQPGGVVRTAYGVLVGAPEGVCQVLRNSPDRYSVKGYGARMAHSVGPGYLGMDDDNGHLEQAPAINAAIEQIREDQAFAEAYQAATAWLARQRAAGQMLAAATGTPQTQLDLERLSLDVLAALCTPWFGQPDGKHLWGTEYHPPTEAPRPRCPGDLLPVSRYVFSPKPSVRVEQAGQRAGQAYVKAVEQWLASEKPADGTLGRAIVDAAWGQPGASLYSVAATFAGIMLGFPPTVHANMLTVLGAWVAKNKLWEIQQQWLEAPAPRHYAHAVARLRPAMLLTLNQRPTPFQVYRLARADHRLGTVDVKAGDTVIAALGSATQANPALHHVAFGGDRVDPQGAPPHACPGYGMGMGVMLGVAAALLEAGTLKPTGSPVSLYLDV
jgi:Dyp-type peroxidase family